MNRLKKIAAAVITAAAVLFTASCEKNAALTQYFFAMDTYIELRGGNSDTQNKVRAEIERIDRLLDCYDKSSALSRINRNGGGENAEIAELLRRSNELSELTDGYFDASLGSIISLWGIGDKNYLPSSDEVNDALLRCGYANAYADGDTIILENGTQLNFGAAAKGYASDMAAKTARENNTDEAIFSLGGNVVLIGDKGGAGYSVSVADPRQPEKSTVGDITGLSDCFAVTSGGYQRYFIQDGNKYCHIFGRDGYPAESGLLSVTVVSDQGLRADAFSTALYAMGLDKSLQFYSENGGFEAVFVTDGGKVVLTDGLKDKFKLTNGEYELCE